MAKKALSERVKSLNWSKLKDTKLREAVNAYRAEQLKPEHDRLSLRDIAHLHGIPTLYSTIWKRYNGTQQSIAEAHQSLQKLTVAEELTLVSFLNESAEHGFPQSHEQIENFANTILQSRLGTDTTQTVGGSWSGRFLDRHRDVLQTHWSKPLDTQRASCMNPEAKKGWFELVKKFVVNLGIKPENLYGMDETGCPASDQGTRKVVGGRGTKTQHKQGGADRENVTAIITICANGTALHPTIIFKATRWNPEWRENNVSGAS